MPPNDSNCKDRSEHLTNTNKQKLYTFCANEMSSQKESQHDQYKENINRNITATMVQSIPSSNNDMNSQYYRPINGNKSKALLRCVVTANQNHLNGSSNLMSK